MSAFGKIIGRIASFFVAAEVGNWLLAHIAAFLHLGVSGVLVGIIVMAASSSSTKSKAVEQRVNGVVSSVGSINQGNMPGGVNVNWSALANFTNTSNTSFLAGLSRLPHQTNNNGNAGGTDGNSGPYWASGERGYINNCINAIFGLAQALNILQTNLQNNGFES